MRRQAVAADRGCTSPAGRRSTPPVGPGHQVVHPCAKTDLTTPTCWTVW
jgi:hypothetical protein